MLLLGKRFPHKLLPFQPNLKHSDPSWDMLNLGQREAGVTAWATGRK